MIKKDILFGVDFGSNKMGVSKSDELHFSAWPYQLIKFPVNNYLVAAKLLNNELIKYNCKLVIVGYPLAQAGGKTFRCLEIDKFLFFLKELDSAVDVIKQDERFSTCHAKSLYLDNLKFRTRKSSFKENKDLLSACLILQSYLNKINW